jgi:type IV secretion system protein VirB11
MECRQIDTGKMASEKDQRVYDMLLSSMGPLIRDLLQDDDVIEIMLNPDGHLWVDRLTSGRSYTGQNVSAQDAERIIRIVSSQISTVCNADNPVLSSELPGSGSRFQGLLPPIVQSPTFTIRKKAIMIFSLKDYVAQGIMPAAFAEVIKQSVKEKQNILIVGGTGSGKTTLANAILDEISKYQERIVIIEDTIELQCKVDDCVALRTKDQVCNMTDLLKATMRLRPDRIIVGEVRGGEALALLKAWNTGHPGGLSTVHANSPVHGLIRLEQLIQEAVTAIPRALIADAVDLVVFIEREGAGRKVSKISNVMGCDSNNEYILQDF